MKTKSIFKTGRVTLLLAISAIVFASVSARAEEGEIEITIKVAPRFLPGVMQMATGALGIIGIRDYYKPMATSKAWETALSGELADWRRAEREISRVGVEILKEDSYYFELREKLKNATYGYYRPLKTSFNGIKSAPHSTWIPPNQATATELVKSIVFRRSHVPADLINKFESALETEASTIARLEATKAKFANKLHWQMSEPERLDYATLRKNLNKITRRARVGYIASGMLIVEGATTLA